MPLAAASPDLPRSSERQEQTPKPLAARAAPLGGHAEPLAGASTSMCVGHEDLARRVVAASTAAQHR